MLKCLIFYFQIVSSICLFFSEQIIKLTHKFPHITETSVDILDMHKIKYAMKPEEVTCFRFTSHSISVMLTDTWWILEWLQYMDHLHWWQISYGLFRNIPEIVWRIWGKTWSTLLYLASGTTEPQWLYKWCSQQAHWQSTSTLITHYQTHYLINMSNLLFTSEMYNNFHHKL